MSNARGLMDDAALEVPCPECGRKVKTTVGAARRNRSIRCPGGHAIEVDGSQLDRGTKDVEKVADNILKKFRS